MDRIKAAKAGAEKRGSEEAKRNTESTKEEKAKNKPVVKTSISTKPDASIKSSESVAKVVAPMRRKSLTERLSRVKSLKAQKISKMKAAAKRTKKTRQKETSASASASQ